MRVYHFLQSSSYASFYLVLKLNTHDSQDPIKAICHQFICLLRLKSFQGPVEQLLVALVPRIHVTMGVSLALIQCL